MIAFSCLDATIAKVKRAIDRRNQRRNDAVEAIDVARLARLAAARPDAATQDRALNPYLSRETIGRVAPSNGPNPAATADG
jgi:hypothetical protein